MVQVHVPARVWGVESLLRHQLIKISRLEQSYRFSRIRPDSEYLAFQEQKMKVSINLRIRTSDGKQPYCPVVWEGKRIKKLKPGWCVVNGVEEFHAEGVYHLSY